jgi:hypothetical protein
VNRPVDGGALNGGTVVGFGAAVDRVRGVFERHLARMAELAGVVSQAAEVGAMSEARMRPALRSRVAGWVAEDDAACGYGFVAAPGVVEERARYLCWFQRSGGDDVRRLLLNLDLDDVNFYDYLDMDWYARAVELRRPAVHGPWVDYTGSGQFVLTCAIPVLHGVRFLGVAGGDLFMTSLEAELLPPLQAVEGEVVLVNADRQAVISNSARWIPGDRLPADPLAHPEQFAAVAAVVEGSGWALAVLPRS